MFAIDYDKLRGLVTCRSEGSFTVAEARRYVTEARAAGQQCMRDWGDLKLLCVSDGQVQSVEVMAAFQNDFNAYADTASTRIALVLPSSLLKLQVNRMMASPAIKCFLSEHAALTWMLAEREARGVAPGAAAA